MPTHARNLTAGDKIRHEGVIVTVFLVVDNGATFTLHLSGGFDDIAVPSFRSFEKV